MIYIASPSVGHLPACIRALLPSMCTTPLNLVLFKIVNAFPISYLFLDLAIFIIESSYKQAHFHIMQQIYVIIPKINNL